MTLRLVDRLLVAVLGIALVGTGLGLLVIKHAERANRGPTVNLEQASEHYQQVRSATVELLGADSDYGTGTTVEVSFHGSGPAAVPQDRTGQ